MLTKEEIASALPSSLRGAATQQFTDDLNNLVTDPLAAEHFRNNFISYVGVLRDGKFKTEDYLHAVAYVSFKLMGYSNQDAYFKTFPQRHAAMLAKGTSPKDISSYVSIYNKGKLVNLILDQTLIPVHIYNQDIYQKAINVQADLMMNASSEKVRSDAANSILTHLAKPKEASTTINVGVKVDAGMADLKETLEKMAQAQLGAMENGVTIHQITEQKLIKSSIEDGSD